MLRRYLFALILAVTLLPGIGCSHFNTSSVTQGRSQEETLQLLTQLPSPLRWPVAHRGSREAGPDNSLQSITGTSSQGIPLIEIDVQMNANGTLFLFHDLVLRANNFQGPPQLVGRETRTLSDQELSLLHHKDFPHVTFTLFEELLQARTALGALFQLDLKTESPAVVEQIITVARKNGALRSILIQCQSIATLSLVRSVSPTTPVLARAHSLAEAKAALPFSPTIVQLDDDFATPDLIAEIHRTGAKVLIKSLGPERDTPLFWKRAFSRNIDLLLTDRPIDLLNER